MFHNCIGNMQFSGTWKVFFLFLFSAAWCYLVGSRYSTSVFFLLFMQTEKVLLSYSLSLSNIALSSLSAAIQVNWHSKQAAKTILKNSLKYKTIKELKNIVFF